MVFNNTEWERNILKLSTNINLVTKLNIKCEKLGNRKGLRVDVSHIYEIDIGESLEMKNLNSLKKFINLKPVQRRRFKMYFIDNLTYRQIAI